MRRFDKLGRRRWRSMGGFNSDLPGISDERIREILNNSAKETATLKQEGDASTREGVVKIIDNKS